MRDYEVTIILQPKLEEKERNELIDRITDLIVPGANEDEKAPMDVWGMRKLAYPIQNHYEGYYVLYPVQIDPTRIFDIERSLRFMEDVLRYLVVRKES